MNTNTYWQGDDEDESTTGSFGEPKKRNQSSRLLVWPGVFGALCLCFGIVTYCKSITIPLDDIEYSVQSVGAAALFFLVLTYFSSKPETFPDVLTRRRLRSLLMLLGALFLAASSLSLGLEIVRTSWPTAEGTIVRHLKRRGLTVLEITLSTKGGETVRRCGLVGWARSHTWRNSEFAPGKAIDVRVDSENPKRIDLNVMVLDRLLLAIPMFILPCVFCIGRARRL